MAHYSIDKLARLSLGICLMGLTTVSLAQNFAGYNNETTTDTMPDKNQPGKKIPVSFRPVVALSPATSFSLAGSLGVQGGTQSTMGGLAAISFSMPVKKGEWRMGGFTFLPYSSGSSDARMYGLNTSYFFGGPVGFEVQYINLFNGAAPATTAHLLLRLSGKLSLGSSSSDSESQTLMAEHSALGESPRRVQSSKGPINWNLTLGLGSYINFADELVARPGQPNTVFDRRRRTTAGFSTFLAGSVSLTRDVDLIFTQWVFRDRATDIGRFSLGVAWHF